MNSSDNFGLNLPEQTDSYDVEHMNENTRAIDTLLNERMALKTITVAKDLNTMLESGIYYFSQNNAHTNMPPNCTNGWLIVMNNDGNVKQVFLRRGSASTHSNAYSRLLSGTGDLIGDWVRYLSELELGLFTNLELDPQATNVVQALNDLYSYCVNQFATKNHTHNYAGSSSAGGSATSAVKLQNARTIQTNLASTSSASFDGTANVTPGVTGVLPVANGGTGTDTLSEAFQTLSESQSLITDHPVNDEDRIMIEYEVIDNNYSFVRTSVAKLAEYVKNKIGNATTSVAGLMSATDKSKIDMVQKVLLDAYPPVTSFTFNLETGTYLLTMKRRYYSFACFWFGLLIVDSHGTSIYEIRSNLNFGDVSISDYTISVSNNVDKVAVVKLTPWF